MAVKKDIVEMLNEFLGLGNHTNSLHTNAP